MIWMKIENQKHIQLDELEHLALEYCYYYVYENNTALSSKLDCYPMICRQCVAFSLSFDNKCVRIHGRESAAKRAKSYVFT